MDFQKTQRFPLVVAVLSAPVAVYLFDWAGFDWQKSFWGWVIFLSADAGMTSFVGTAMALAMLLIKVRRNRR
ncbi:MAG: hypothetical protein ACXWC4_10975 [Telluria sp.]